MKQIAEEAAKEYAKGVNRHGDVSYCTSDIEAFEAGVEWLKSMFSMFKFPPCSMPEDGIKLEEGTIVATTDDYVIFYKHKGFDIAYREFFVNNSPVWCWKVKYGRYVKDDEILCWMKNSF